MKGCELDTDGDGNCPRHPRGCPVPDSHGDIIEREAWEQAIEQQIIDDICRWIESPGHDTPAEVLLGWRELAKGIRDRSWKGVPCEVTREDSAPYGGHIDRPGADRGWTSTHGLERPPRNLVTDRDLKPVNERRGPPRRDDDKITVQWVVGGHQAVTTQPSWTKLEDARDSVLFNTHNTLIAFDNWDVRDKDGNLLDLNKTLKELAQAIDAGELTISTRAGSGG